MLCVMDVGALALPSFLNDILYQDSEPRYHQEQPQVIGTMSSLPQGGKGFGKQPDML